MQILRQHWNARVAPHLENYDMRHVQVIVRTVETVDVQWQDGTITKNIEARQLKPAYAIDDYDFWPRMAVSRKTRGLGLNADANVRHAPLNSGGGQWS